MPPQTSRGVNNLLRRIEEMNTALQPTFVTVTWRSAFKVRRWLPPRPCAGVGSQWLLIRAPQDENLWLRIGTRVQRDIGVDVLLHLTCHLPVSDLKRILRRVREAGLKNILALRGDPPIGQERVREASEMPPGGWHVWRASSRLCVRCCCHNQWRPVAGGLSNAVDLVRLIREEHGDYFCVAVAG